VVQVVEHLPALSVQTQYHQKKKERKKKEKKRKKLRGGNARWQPKSDINSFAGKEFFQNAMSTKRDVWHNCVHGAALQARFPQVCFTGTGTSVDNS
jgi:hypothetical protein